MKEKTTKIHFEYIKKYNLVKKSILLAIKFKKISFYKIKMLFCCFVCLCCKLKAEMGVACRQSNISAVNQ
jgi:hypothetical protein